MTQHLASGPQAPVRHDLPHTDNPHNSDPYEEEEDDGGSCSRYAWDLLRSQSQNGNAEKAQPTVFRHAYDRAWQEHVDSNGDGTLTFTEMQEFTGDHRHSPAARQAIALVEAYDREFARLRAQGVPDRQFGYEAQAAMEAGVGRADYIDPGIRYPIVQYANAIGNMLVDGNMSAFSEANQQMHDEMQMRQRRSEFRDQMKDVFDDSRGL